LINELNRSLPITNDGGKMVLRFSTWAKNVTALQILTGTGSPEGTVEADQLRLYMDNTGTTGNILYIKRDPDDGAGDKSIGWILV